MAAQAAVRKWGNNLVNVMIKGATSEASPVQLYLAAGESDQATSGHIFLDNLRTLMRGLPTDIPIMACEDIHAVFTKGAPLQCDVNDLFQKAFTTGSELVVWPGINNSKEDRILLLVLRARLWCLEEPEDQNLALCGQEAFCNWHNLSFLCGSDRSCNVGGDNPLQKEILDITGVIVSGNTASMVSL